MRGKVKYNELSDFEKKKYLGEFYTMVSLLRTREEVKRFLKDILTLSETVMISRRIQIAKFLLKGKTYDEIMNNLKVSAATIAQVEKWLNNGFGGYKEIIKRYGKKQLQKKDYLPKTVTPFTFDHIRKKYPLHFLLVNLLMKRK
ncbi:MAG: YerC/YecD family TrpR-related protein [Candidatus Moranbacteria bacterium]|nr:YerC/YecD family TrpR-related protein [Candidatus Moranbacteria bacterium]